MAKQRGIDTEMADRFLGDSDDQKKAFGETHPVGRMGQSEEIAEAVYLASDAAKFTTGISLPVGGGYLAR